MRDRFVGNDRVGRDVLRELAEAGAEDDAGRGRARPLRANRGCGFLDLIEEVGHVRSEVRGQRIRRQTEKASAFTCCTITAAS